MMSKEMYLKCLESILLEGERIIDKGEKNYTYFTVTEYGGCYFKYFNAGDRAIMRNFLSAFGTITNVIIRFDKDGKEICRKYEPNYR